MANRHQERRGQATVEFALCAVLLMTIFCAIFELAWTFYNCSYLSNALSTAARLAVTASRRPVALADVEREVTQAVGGLPIGSPRVTTYDVRYTSDGLETTEVPGAWQPRPGQWVKVSAEIPYPNLTPLSRLIVLAGYARLTGECMLPVE